MLLDQDFFWEMIAVCVKMFSLSNLRLYIQNVLPMELFR